MEKGVQPELHVISTVRFHTFHRFHAAHAKDRICSSTTLHLQTPERHGHWAITDIWTNKNSIDCWGKRNLTAYMCKNMPLVMLFSMNCQSLVQPQHPKARPRTAQDTTERIKTCFSLCLLTFLLLTILAHHSTTKKSPTKYATFYYRYKRVCVLFV